jgi:hypothetical protein
MTDEQQTVIERLAGLLEASQPEIGSDELRMSADERNAIAYALKLVKLEGVVQEVIGKLRSYDTHGFDASDRAALIAAVRKLAEWKP